MPESSPAAHDTRDDLAELLEIGIRLDDTAAHECEVIIVGGDALERPEQARVDLLVEPCPLQHLRANPLDVPEMKIFMAAEAQEATILFRYSRPLLRMPRRKLVATADQARRVTVLEPAVAVPDGGDEKEVTLDRKLVKKPGMHCADPLEIPCKTIEIAIMPPDNSDAMLDPVDTEGALLEFRDLDRVVDQRFVVESSVIAETLLAGFDSRQGCSDSGPFRQLVRRLDGDKMRLLFAALEAQENRGAVEIGVGVVDMGTAHGEIIGVDLVMDRDLPFTPIQAPALLVELGHLRCVSARCHMERNDIACKIADHVTAGNPCRQVKNHLRLTGVEPHLDIDETGMEVRKADSVRGQLGFPLIRHPTDSSAIIWARPVFFQERERCRRLFYPVFAKQKGVGDYFFISWKNDL